MKPTLKNGKRLLLVFLFFALHGMLPASDHIDGPVTTSHAVADITGLFAFPSPDFPGHLALIMNVYPGVGASGHFSDKVTYRFLIKQANILGQGAQSGFGTSGDYWVSCTFETPHGNNTPHWVTCTSSTGSSVRIQVGDMNGLGTDGNLRVFAGHRSDPFFFNAGWAVAASKGTLKEPKNSNLINNLNVLSIAVVIDIEKELGLNSGPLFAIAAETTTMDGKNTRQIDRIGRPEITNITMANNGREELRNLYNAQKPFDLSGENVALFRQRLRDNISFYDKLNNSTDWTPELTNTLAEVLLNDFLVVDVSKPFTLETYFEIENAILRGKTHATCGGRVPNEDIIDVIFTMLINGGKKPMIKDGSDHPTNWATAEFPYLATPNAGVASAVKSFILRSADKLTASKKMMWIGIIQLLSGLLAVIGGILLLYYFLRQVFARIGKNKGKYAEHYHSRLMFSVGLMYGLAGIFAAITNAFPINTIVGFAIISIIAFFFFAKWRKMKVDENASSGPS